MPDIPVRDRLIHALDVSSVDEAKRRVELLGDHVWFYKLGLQLFMAGGYFELVEWLRERDKKVFVDLKFFDVPETVGRAVAQLRGRDVHFVTVHGQDGMLRSAAAQKQEVKILAVTVLTSVDQGDLEALGFQVSVEDLVLSRARRAIQLGCDGVVSSGLEAPRLRRELGDSVVIVTPGIRPVANVDDQKRTVDVDQAFQNGADYIVVGRPIAEASDPIAVAQGIQLRITKAFAQPR